MNGYFTPEQQGKLRDVATLLGEGFEISQPYSHVVNISNAETGVDFNVNTSNGRFVFSAYLRSEHGTYFTPAEEADGLKAHHEISASENKAPELLAKDIKRRLLPCYLLSLASVQARDAKINAAQAVKENELAALRAVGGKHATITSDRDVPNTVSVRYDSIEPYGSFKISDYRGLHYKVELDNVRPELAAHIMTLLVESR